MANKPVINLDQLEFQVFQNGERFESNRASASQHIGGSKLGYTVVVLKPGKRAWPYHSHFINEEMFFILEGEGTLRHAGERSATMRGVLVWKVAELAMHQTSFACEFSSTTKLSKKRSLKRQMVFCMVIL